MSVPQTLLDNLVDFWPIDEGRGGVAYGVHAGTALRLKRIDPCSTPPYGEPDPDTGWYDDAGDEGEAGRPAYNGCARLELPRLGGLKVPAAAGEGFTLLMRLLPRKLIGSCTPASTRRSHVMGAPGLVRDGVFSQGLSFTNLRYNAANHDDLVALVQSAWDGSGPVGVGGDYTDGFASPADPVVMAMRVKHTGTQVVAEAFADGVSISDELVCAAAGFPSAFGQTLADFQFGAWNTGIGGISRACLAAAPLSDAELMEIGDPGGLVEVEAACRDLVPAPWLHADGTPWLVPEPGLEREHGGADGQSVLASDGEGGRHTRAVHEHGGVGGGGGPRRLRMVFGTADGEQVERIRQGLVLTGGGARSMRWRHPIDDGTGPRRTAPRVRIVSNPTEIERTPGGVIGKTEVEIEYTE
jgi:hypothetical protein